MRTPSVVARVSLLLALVWTVATALVACGSSSEKSGISGPAGAQGGITNGGGGYTANAGSGVTGAGGTGVAGTAAGGSAAGLGNGGQSLGGAAAGGANGVGAGAAVSGGGGAGVATAGGAGAGGAGAGGAAAGGAAAGGATNGKPAIMKDDEVLLTKAGLTIVSYGGYLNGESFQQDGIASFQGYQYAALWNSNRHVVLGRRALPSGAWSTIEFSDYTNTADDAHNTISLGICPGDGTLHLSFDHHDNDLHYRKSVAGLLTNPTTAAWATSSFSAVTSVLTGNTAITLLTYPRFVSEPGGKKMLFEARIGGSGSGDEYLWEYDSASSTWLSLGRYINGTSNSINAYPHGLSYEKGGSRLHLSWCWRETPDASTNHDLLYAYSDDNGRTWKNDLGAIVASTGASFITESSPGIKVWTIKQNRGLINQEHMAVDSAGRVHVLLSHMPDAQADDAVFDSARTKSQFFHYYRDSNGAWSKIPMGFPAVASFRGKLAISSSNNLYAVLPDLRIAAASLASNFSDWAVLDSADSNRFFSDPLIDTARLLTEDKLSVFYPQKSSSNLYVLDYTLL